MTGRVVGIDWSDVSGLHVRQTSPASPSMLCLPDEKSASAASPPINNAVLTRSKSQSPHVPGVRSPSSSTSCTVYKLLVRVRLDAGTYHLKVGRTYMHERYNDACLLRPMPCRVYVQPVIEECTMSTNPESLQTLSVAGLQASQPLCAFWRILLVTLKQGRPWAVSHPPEEARWAAGTSDGFLLDT